MIVARYAMGWWPSKIIVVFNTITLLGYAMIDCVVAGQILSAVSPNGSMSVIVGVIIVAVITWTVTTLGYRIFHFYERYNWVPQLIVLCILAGVAGQYFDLTTPSEGDARTIVGSRLSFFSICYAGAATYAGAAADFFVYYPEDTPWTHVAVASYVGLTPSFTLPLLIGVGLATGVASNPTWSTAYEVSQGALIVEGYRPLGSFGSFCSVVVALGLIANMIPPTYASGVDMQVLGRHLAMVPRVVWNTLGVVVYTVCAAAGRAHLAEIFTNFLALMGYWTSIWIAITIEEHIFFRRKRKFDWTVWDKKDKLPLGIAAFVAFVVGWVGAILCMAQVWYIGPIA
ncbi:hypothetical protein LTS18_000165, partial [Coniosporium uncinatum]